jgi:multicomponent K+:H+ antiporter subunit E
MKRLDRNISPVLVLALFVFWLVLNQTVAPAQMVLGALVATFLSWSASALRPLQAHVKRLDVAAILAIVVLIDIVRSNIAVGRNVLGLAGREIQPGFLEIPLELRDPHGLAVLAVIVTSTPGTVWAGLSPDGRTLTLHVLDLYDEGEWIRVIKTHYEQPLMRIFQ